ncbi:MAG: dihydrolipoyl dehydrogenase [Thaumarchaeota archaeon]|nr:dihydrolipoyl dehydrogenase [Nitrososphaerota archaeon]MDG6932966.1 dihydrolipoyl dehydrogenase [Nitrososphaerota archaeon]
MLGKYPVLPLTDNEFTDAPNKELYDAIIVGGGGGGYHGGFELSRGGKSVMLVDDKGNLGGNCLYEGCIPSKSAAVTIYLMEKVRNILRGSGNSNVKNLEMLWEDVMNHKDEVQSTRYRQHIREIKEHQNLDFARGTARFVDSHTLEVQSLDGSWKKTVSGKNTIIATGSVASTIPVPGAELAIGSLELFGYRTSYRNMPDSITIIGGGYIGVEVSSMLSSLGKSVTVLEMLPRIMGGWDSELVSEMEKMLQKRNVNVITGARVSGIKMNGRQKEVSYTMPDGKNGSLVSDEVIMAAGRKPYVEGLETLGIVKKGHVEVDSAMRTSLPNVYATGDVTGKYMLFHAAVKESVIAAWNILHGMPVYEFNYSTVPVTVFTEPEASVVGIGEEEARARGIAYSTVKYPLEDDAYAQIIGIKDGWLKLIVERETQRIIGGSIYGDSASMVINEIALAIAGGTRVKDLAQLAHQHPTIFESIDRTAVKFSV